MNVAFVIFGVDGVVAGAKSESRSSGRFRPGHVGRGIQYNIRARVGIVAGSGLVGRAGPGETAKDQVRSGWARLRRSQAGSGWACVVTLFEGSICNRRVTKSVF